MILWLAVILAVIAILVPLIYFLTQRRRQDEIWQRFRNRYRERRTHWSPEQPIDPNFQFDRPPGDEAKDKPCDPN
ncbi:MAG TPA: hypothetical protein VH643_11875 [Gemmataceae bacterium]|jgi:hypothetical protein